MIKTIGTHFTQNIQYNSNLGHSFYCNYFTRFEKKHYL